MNLNEYQKQALKTAIYSKNDFYDLMHWVLGIGGESGEIAEKLKKIIRDKKGEVSDSDKQDIVKEIGDVLWYLAILAHHLDTSLDDIAKQNIEKLASRKARNQLKGAGDNR